MHQSAGRVVDKRQQCALLRTILKPRVFRAVNLHQLAKAIAPAAWLMRRRQTMAAVSRNYPHGLADEDVLAIARQEQRILVVADRDFGELIFNQRLAHAGVLFFRLPGAQLQTKIEHLDQALENQADDLAAGKFVVVAPGNIRVAGRPGA
jgi:predicted nuclease of predicted toxin-antitoxin system